MAADVLPLWLIANELAELNRLKRIEIEWANDGMSNEALKNVKEDHAE